MWDLRLRVRATPPLEGRVARTALWLAGFTRIDLRPHVVGGFDIAAREVEEFAVGRMVRLLHALDMRPDRGMLLGQIFGEEVLLLRGADDEDGAGVGDRFRDFLEERLFSSILWPVRFSRA